MKFLAEKINAQLVAKHVECSALIASAAVLQVFLQHFQLSLKCAQVLSKHIDLCAYAIYVLLLLAYLRGDDVQVSKLSAYVAARGLEQFLAFLKFLLQGGTLVLQLVDLFCLSRSGHESTNCRKHAEEAQGFMEKAVWHRFCQSIVWMKFSVVLMCRCPRHVL